MNFQKKLSQDKLDVLNKTRTNLFDWRGQFTPQFVEYMLANYTNKGDVVVDPFAGSGTVLHECAYRNLKCIGMEINPSAFAMSKFFSFTNLKPNERINYFQEVERKIDSLKPKYEKLPMYTKQTSHRQSYEHLIKFASELLSLVANTHESIIALNILFLCEKSRCSDFNIMIRKALTYIYDALLMLPFTELQIDAILSDARLSHKLGLDYADLILTSPPYINVFNYHQNYRSIIECTGWDILKVAQSEFGSNRKHRSNRFMTVVQYCLDMEQSLISFWQLLKNDGYMIMVVGKESNVRHTPFYNGSIVKDIINNLGIFKEIDNYQRSFINKFGTVIKEDILIFTKLQKTPPQNSVARQVSLKHLTNALKICDPQIRKEIDAVINKVDSIEPSPIFNPKGGDISEKNVS